MPESASGMSGRRQAVLKNLQDGTHTWMCTATNDLGSDNVTVTFTGAFCSVQMSLRIVSTCCDLWNGWQILSSAAYELFLRNVGSVFILKELCKERRNQDNDVHFVALSTGSWYRVRLCCTISVCPFVYNMLVVLQQKGIIYRTVFDLLVAALL